MGGSTLPTANTPGYGWYRATNGSTWVACDCLIAWLPWLERVLKARGLIKSSIDPWQLTGGAIASGGTHSRGGAFDLLFQTSPAHVAVCREMGAPATWGRTVAQGFSKAHTHGVLSGCPHNGPAAYQIDAQRRGYNGLGRGTTGAYAGMWGYGGRDEFRDPTVYRTWREGIAWARAEVARLTASTVTKPTPTPTPAPPQEADMPLSPADAQLVARYVWGADGIIASPDKSPDNPEWAGGSYLRETFRLLRTLRDESKVRDEAQTAAIQALAAAKDVDPAQIAALVDKAVRDRLDRIELTVTDTPAS